MAKVGGKLTIWLYIGTIMAGKSKKLSKNTLSLTGLDNRGIVTGFYDKKQRHSREIRFCPNFKIY